MLNNVTRKYKGAIARELEIGEKVHFTISGMTLQQDQEYDILTIIGTTENNEYVCFKQIFSADWAISRFFSQILPLLEVTGIEVDFLEAVRNNYGKTIIVECIASKNLNKNGEPYPFYTFKKEEI